MDISNIVEKFKNREYKAKEVFEIREIDKDTSYQFIRRYHYLGDAKFFSMYQYGLYIKDTNIIVGSATYSLPQGKDSNKGWWGLPPNDPSIVELSRLCILPNLNGTNATSYLLGNSLKMLKQHKVRACITLADASRHIGSIYQVCNFTYYGLCDKKADFYWIENSKHPYRSKELKIRNLYGVWLPKTRKHRYAYILDKTLKCNYLPQPRPRNKDNVIEYTCCHNTFVVYDKRYDMYFTCPKCTSKMIELSKEEYEKILSLSKELSKEKLKEYVENIILEYRRKNGEMYIEELF